MKQNQFWKVVIILFIVAWSIYEFYPPTNRSLIDEFENQAVKRDAAFTNIVNEARSLQKQFPNREFGNLLTAITNNLGDKALTNYFTGIEVPAGKDQVRAVLNELQREAAGKIKLGLDLQGGMSFL